MPKDPPNDKPPRGTAPPPPKRTSGCDGCKLRRIDLGAEDAKCDLCEALAEIARLRAERDELTDRLDLMLDEFARIAALTSDAEIKGLCDRAKKVIRQSVPVIVQRDELLAVNARLRALCDALLWEGPRPACMTEQRRAIDSARRAVDEAGDLIAKARRE